MASVAWLGTLTAMLACDLLDELSRHSSGDILLARTSYPLNPLGITIRHVNIQKPTGPIDLHITNQINSIFCQDVDIGYDGLLFESWSWAEFVRRRFGLLGLKYPSGVHEWDLVRRSTGRSFQNLKLFRCALCACINVNVWCKLTRFSVHFHNIWVTCVKINN